MTYIISFQDLLSVRLFWKMDVLDLFARRLFEHMPADDAFFQFPGFYANQRKILLIPRMVQWLNGETYLKIPAPRVSRERLKQLNTALERFGKYAEPGRKRVFVFPGNCLMGRHLNLTRVLLIPLKRMIGFLEGYSRFIW